MSWRPFWHIDTSDGEVTAVPVGPLYLDSSYTRLNERKQLFNIYEGMMWSHTSIRPSFRYSYERDFLCKSVGRWSS